MVILRASCISVLLSLSATSLHAQSADANDPVQVNISDHEMVKELATLLHVDASQIPVTVQVEAQVATGVCGAAESSLKHIDISDLANCDATTTSPAFRQAVSLQLLVD